jgi:hypothetical protein
MATMVASSARCPPALNPLNLFIPPPKRAATTPADVNSGEKDQGARFGSQAGGLFLQRNHRLTHPIGFSPMPGCGVRPIAGEGAVLYFSKENVDDPGAD